MEHRLLNLSSRQPVTPGSRGRHLFTIAGLRYGVGDDLALAGRDPTFLDLMEYAGNAEIAHSDLTIAFTESEQGLAGSCEYNADRLDETQAQALTKHFEALLKEAVTRPGARISSFEMLDAAEKHRILIDWNGEARGYLPHCVHELFEQQVERTPDATAVVFEDSRLTYRELNRRANQLAHYLRRNGVGLEMPVGLLMDASLEIAIAIIAILKAGGAYLPLNTRQPAHRLREIVRESRLSLAVTTAANAGYHAIADATEFVRLDLDGSRIAMESTSNPCSGVSPDNIASLRYTSGSTGKPKGSATIHRSMTSRLTSLLPEIAANDVCLANTSWGAASRVLYPLALGATVVIVSGKDVRDVSWLTASLERNGISSMYIVPSHLRQLLDDCPDLSRRLERLRTVTTGGEVLTVDLAARFRESLPHARLFNTYTNSESGAVATEQIAGDSLATDSLATDSLATGNPIGRPVVNTRVYLLDRDMHLVPQGVTGEIYVGSGHLSRGYPHRPDLTALRLVPDPFGPWFGGRLFRTGDLGRHLPDGKIEFAGRADRQVKVRGFRVEPGEIEVVLHDHHQVERTVVVAQNDRLVAYVVTKAGAKPGVSRLQSFLRERLPDYMVPPVFVFLDRMPLNGVGKVDMQALPVPGGERPLVSSAYEAPRNPIEVAIAEIWSEVLGLETVGINDNFIELGGDSLLATSVSARLRRRHGLDVPMELILEWSIAVIALETTAETTAPG
jgi:amino acid adenylation domain-containing protein